MNDSDNVSAHSIHPLRKHWARQRCDGLTGCGDIVALADLVETRQPERYSETG
jgi:hypothetical protein